MNILHLEASAGWGGQEIRILREAEGMRDRSHEVYFAVMQGGALIEKGRKKSFAVYEINFSKKRWISAFFQILSIIRRHKIDLINTHSSLDSWIGGFVARKAGIPILRTRHLSTPIKGGLNSRLLYGKLADFVVTTCSSIVPLIAQQSGKSIEQIRSIPTGVCLEEMKASEEQVRDFRRSLGVDPEQFLIGCACFMRSWKGIEDFIHAAELLRDKKELKWILIGGGHCAKYRERVKQKGLEKQVLFTGHLENPLPALRSLNAFALLSTAHEGVSQAILQAAYFAKPLIATQTGGLCEVCLSEKTGYLVDPFSPHQVASSVLQLWKDPFLCDTLGKRAKKIVLEQFTFAQTLDQMEEVYQVIQSNRRESHV